MTRPLKLGFGSIESALQAMHGVEPELASRFRGRLRYLQRSNIGVPRAGVGRRANFTAGHALLFALAMELEQFGMASERVAAVFDALGLGVEVGTLREAVYVAAERIGTDRPGVLIWFFPEALAGATKGSDCADMAAASVDWGDWSQIPQDAFATSGLSRLAIVNLSALISDLIEHLEEDASAIADALMAWANNEEGK